MPYIGVDIIALVRIEGAIARWGDCFLKRVYTAAELELCGGHVPSLTSRFAAKEAVIKALGGLSQGFTWRDIEILSDPRGRPLINLYGSMRERAGGLGVDRMEVSLSDCDEYAVAFVFGAEAK
ncbi:MAG: holo-ACP synthase [Dehalococcoidales bacterium]|nr:holo-ACP synthase [Dehalococcoidales bacterium]